MPLSISVGEAEIRNAIAVGIAEAFTGEKKDALIRDIVRAHLQVKESSYDKETLLSKRVGEMLRKVAMEVVAVKIEDMRPDVERIVSEMLGPSFQDSVLRGLRAGLQQVVVRNINIQVNPE